MMTKARGDVFTVADFATYLKVLKSTVYKLAQEGKVPAQKVGKHWRFHRPTIDQWLFASHQGQSQFDQLNESGAKAGLNLPTVRSLLFPKPEYPEQKRIAAILDASVSALSGHLQNRNKLIALKTGLMQDLLSGDRRVTALLEQPAEVTT